MNAQKQLFAHRPPHIPIITVVNMGSTRQLERCIAKALKLQPPTC